MYPAPACAFFRFYAELNDHLLDVCGIQDWAGRIERPFLAHNCCKVR